MSVQPVGGEKGVVTGIIAGLRVGVGVGVDAGRDMAGQGRATPLGLRHDAL